MTDNPSKEPDNQAKETKDSDNQKLLAGKYRSVEDLEKGYWELSKEGLKQRDARIRAEAERDAILQQTLQQNQRQGGQDPLAEAFREADIPIEALDARVEAKALGILQNLMQPMMQQQSAEQRMLELHPDWPGVMEVSRGLAPEAAESYRHMLTKDPEHAMELGYQAWKAGQQKPPVSAIDEHSKRAASPPRGRGGESKQESEPFDKDQYRELLAEAVQTGDWTKFGRFRFANQPWFKRMTEGDEW